MWQSKSFLFWLKGLHCVYGVENFCESELTIYNRKTSLLIKLTDFKIKFPSPYLLSLVLHLTSVTLTPKAPGRSRVPMVGGSSLGLAARPQQRHVVTFQPWGFSGHCPQESKSSCQEEDWQSTLRVDWGVVRNLLQSPNAGRHLLCPCSCSYPCPCPCKAMFTAEHFIEPGWVRRRTWNARNTDSVCFLFSK